MCEPRSVAVPSPVLQGVAVAGVCLGIATGVWALVGTVAFLAAPVLALALPVGLAICRAREHRIPVRAQSMAQAETRPARELEARKMVEAAPARLALESARPVVEGVVLTEKVEVER
ncbi:hypothetical protein ACIBI0_38535 [Microbispora rosea]|uniref:hypothetical protein n=1 Tax=Microbispora rosea TaxID=58117 RepID=UPI00379A451C